MTDCKLMEDDSDCELVQEKDSTIVTINDSSDDENDSSDNTKSNKIEQEIKADRKSSSQEVVEIISQTTEESQEDSNSQQKIIIESTQSQILSQNENQSINSSINSDVGVKHLPLFRILFNMQKHYIILKDPIINALRSCLEENGIKNIEFAEDFNFLDICVTEKICPDTVSDVLSSETCSQAQYHLTSDEEQKNQQNQNIANSETTVTDGMNKDNDSLFLIDTTPQKKLNTKIIPCYKRSTREILKHDAKKQKTDDDRNPSRPNMCFNCMGNHSLKDCRQPRNQQRINKNRNAFKSTRNVDRYHREAEQRFSHLKPGHLSENLRKALDLRSDQIPIFVYRMRLLGYPPGWLEEAKIPDSGLTLFDSEGRKVLDENEEDGEIDVEKYKYDAEKIISFPGYNVDAGPGFIDDHKYYGVPPMLPKFKKENFIKSLGDEKIMRGYKRKKLKDISAGGNDLTTLANLEEDMEIEDNEIKEIIGPTLPIGFNLPIYQPPPPPVPPPPKSPPPPPPPLPSENSRPSDEDIINENEVDISCDSPSLAELEERQKQILEALQNSTTILDTSADPTQINNDQKSNNESNSQVSLTDLTIELSSQESADEIPIQKSSVQTVSDKSDKSHGSSTKLMLGTPILKFSPYDKLPSGEKFSVGVSDVINFENLADSTGKYEQMKQVLKKVRNVVTQLNMDE